MCVVLCTWILYTCTPTCSAVACMYTSWLLIPCLATPSTSPGGPLHCWEIMTCTLFLIISVLTAGTDLQPPSISNPSPCQIYFECVYVQYIAVSWWKTIHYIVLYCCLAQLLLCCWLFLVVILVLWSLFPLCCDGNLGMFPWPHWPSSPVHPLFSFTSSVDSEIACFLRGFLIIVLCSLVCVLT